LTANLHPEIPQIVDGQPGAALLREAQRLRSAWDDHRHHQRTASFTGTDEDKTVEATVNGNLQLTGLRIEDGLLRLGTEAVGQRINEALRNAGAAATGAVGAEQEKLLAELGFTAEVMKQFDSVIDKFEPRRA